MTERSDEREVTQPMMGTVENDAGSQRDDSTCLGKVCGTIGQAARVIDELDWCSHRNSDQRSFLEDFEDVNIYMIVSLWASASGKTPSLKRFYPTSIHNALNGFYYIVVVGLALAGNIYMPFLYVKELIEDIMLDNPRMQDFVESISSGQPGHLSFYDMLRVERAMVQESCPDQSSMEVKVMVVVMFILLCHQAFATFKVLPQQYNFVRALQKQQQAECCGISLKFSASPVLWLGFVANICSLFYVPMLLDMMFVGTEANPEDRLHIADVVLNGLSVYFVLEVDEMLVTAGDKVLVQALVNDVLERSGDEADAPTKMENEDTCTKLLLILWALGGLAVMVLYGIIVVHAGKCV